MPRKDALVNGQVYHIFTKSIARSKIFASDEEYSRMRDLIAFYQYDDDAPKFSLHKKRVGQLEGALSAHIMNANGGKEKRVQVIAYCLMPTHIHFVIKQMKDNGISRFMADLKNSYTRYFNLHHRRKGPLWEGRFKNVLIETSDQLAHVTRYVHLNPVSSAMIEKPEEWKYSSYAEYLCVQDHRICDYYGIVNMSPDEYRAYTHDQAAHQRMLQDARHLIIE